MPSLLAGFASTPVTRLDLSSPKSYGFSIPAFISTELLTPFFAWNKFSQLTTISLRNTPLCLDDLALLRVQLSLTTLDLCNTSITTPELMHLSCHRHTLTSLNIESNDIKDEAWSILAHFPKLAALSLRDTKFTMPGLRWLVKNGIPRGCRLINVPAHAYETLNNREQRYCCNIPDGYVVDPAKVDGLGVPVLKHNLELHAKFGRTSTAGTKIELVHRLRAILDTRLAEEKLLGVLGPKH